MYNTLKTLAGAATGAFGAAVLDSMLLRPHVASEAGYLTVWSSCALPAASGTAVAAVLGGGRGSAGRTSPGSPVLAAAAGGGPDHAG